jgi:hypothetical protein
MKLTKISIQMECLAIKEFVFILNLSQILLEFYNISMNILQVPFSCKIENYRHILDVNLISLFAISSKTFM